MDVSRPWKSDEMEAAKWFSAISPSGSGNTKESTRFFGALLSGKTSNCNFDMLFLNPSAYMTCFDSLTISLFKAELLV
ncbi:hypothetical protein Tco_0776871 [Tanacetum coccineum]